MKKSPLVSVLTTTFNADFTIKQTLNSIADQTYQNFEIVVVDDGSKDRTVNVIENWQKRHGNISLKLFQPGRLGRAKALNYGVEKSMVSG